MRCLACQRTVPPQAQEANFCYGCGRPLKQHCPYEVEGQVNATRLPLYGEDGRPTGSCPKCKGLFNSCQTCHRLYKLDASRCATQGCEGLLIEPVRPFPSLEGPLDNTARVLWPGSFKFPDDPPAPQRMDRLQGMVFRYGLLICAGLNTLRTYRWQNEKQHGVWIQEDIHVLAQGVAQLRIHSLMVDKGKIYLLSDRRALAYTITGGLRELYSDDQPFIQQIVGDNWWVRLAADGRILLQVGDSWETERIDLPALYGHATCLTSDSHTLYIATDCGYLLKLDPQQATLDVVATLGNECQWQRISVSNNAIALLGRHATTYSGMLALVRTDGTYSQGPTNLGAGNLTDFVWMDDRIYVGREQDSPRASVIDSYNMHYLVNAPETHTLDGGSRTQLGMLGLVDSDGNKRLLLQRRNATAQRYELLDPASGRRQPISTFTAEPQQACLADTALVIARSSQQQTQLDTIPII